jgi:hypothetical protein
MGTLLLILPRYFSLLLIESLAVLFLSGAYIFLNVYVKAVLWNLKNLGDTLFMRKKIQKMRKVSDKIIQRSMIKKCTRILIYKEIIGKRIFKIQLQ